MLQKLLAELHKTQGSGELPFVKIHPKVIAQLREQ